MKSTRTRISVAVVVLIAGLLAVVVPNGGAGAWIPAKTAPQLGQTALPAYRNTGGAYDRPMGAAWQQTLGQVTADPNRDYWQFSNPEVVTLNVGWEYSTVSGRRVTVPGDPVKHQAFYVTTYGQVFPPSDFAGQRAFARTGIVLDDPADGFVDLEDIRISDLLIPGSLSYQWSGDAGDESFAVAAVGKDFCAYVKRTRGTYGLAEAPRQNNEFTPWVRLPYPAYNPLTMTCVDPNFRDPSGLVELSLKRGTSVSVRNDGSVDIKWLDLGAFAAKQTRATFTSTGAPQANALFSLSLVGLSGLTKDQLVSAGEAVDAGSGLVVVSPKGSPPLVGRLVDGASSVSLVPAGGVYPGSGFPDGVAVDATKLADAADLQILKDSTGAYLVQRGSTGGTWVATLSLPTGSAAASSSSVGRWYAIGGFAQPGSIGAFVDATSNASELTVTGSDNKTLWFKPLRASANAQQVGWATTVVAEDGYPVGAQFALNTGESVLQWTPSLLTGTPGGLQATGGAASMVVVQTNQRLLFGRLTNSGGSAGFVAVSGGPPTTSDGTGINVVPLPGSHDYAAVLDAADGTPEAVQIGDGALGSCMIGVLGCSGTHTTATLAVPAPGAGQAKGLSAATRSLLGSPIHVMSVPQPTWDPAHNTYLWSATALNSSGKEVPLYQLTGSGLGSWGGWYTNTVETAPNIGGFVDATTLAKINTAQVAATYAPTSPTPDSATVHSVWVRQDTVIDSFSGNDQQILEVHQADTINGQVTPGAVTVTISRYVDTPVATVAGDGTVILLGANSATGPPGDGHLLRFTAISSAGAVVRDAAMSNSFIVGGNAGGHGDSVGAALVQAKDFIIAPPTSLTAGIGAAHYVFTVATRGSDDSRLYAVGMTLDLNTTLPTTTAVATGADPFLASSYNDSLLSTDLNGSSKADFGGSISGAPALVSTAANSVTMFVLGFDGNNNGKAYKLTTPVNGLGVPTGGGYSTVGNGFPTTGGHAYRDDSLSITPITPDSPHGLYSNPLSAPNATIDPGTRNVLVAWTGSDGTWVSTLNSDASSVQYWDEEKLVSSPVYTPSILTPNSTNISTGIGGLIYTPLPSTSTDAATTVVFGTSLRLFNQPIPTF